MSTTGLDRRTALRQLALGGAGAFVLPAWVDALTDRAAEHAHAFHAQAARATAPWKPKVLSAHQNATVVELTELIIPQTDTPGARAARVNEFVDGTLADAPAAERERFLAGLAWLDARSTRDYGAPFVKAAPAQQHALLTTLAAPEALSGPDKEGAEFFVAIKSLTIVGYYTSEIGARELGDDLQVAFAEFTGCTHPHHQQ
ncbi:MAG TPA: gluconate 2-dehydrogenase subunit 3 family protein [Vicinamibacterales bacterium]